MKIIGIGQNRDTYLCEVNHTELEKFMNLYYGKLDRLKAGETIDLGAGYDHASQIRDALAKTEDFIKSSGKIISAITNGIGVAKELGKSSGMKNETTKESK